MKTNKKIEIYFTLFLLLIFLIFVILAIGYNPTARVVPLIVGIPGVILCAILLSSYYIPAVDKRINTLKQKTFFEVEVGDEKKQQKNLQKSEEEFKKTSLKELNMVAWIIGFLIGIYILGFIVAIPLFTFLFLKFREKESLRMSILVSAGSWAAIYTMFSLLLKAQLYSGLFY